MFAVQNYQKVQARCGEDAPSYWNKALSTSQWKCCTSGRRNWKFFLLQENRYVILLSSQNSVSSTQWEEKVCSLVHELHTVFQNYLNADTCYGVSSATLEILCIAGGVRARALLSAASLFSAGQVPYQGDAQAGSDDEPPEVKECLGDINICVSQKQYTQIFSRFYAFIQWLQQQISQGRTWTLWGCRTFFSNMVRFPSPAGGKGAGRNWWKSFQACGNRGGSAAFP